MSKFKGFAELLMPRDLVVRKQEYDLERIRKSPQDQYAAFGFFVTAEHIVDWVEIAYPQVSENPFATGRDGRGH